MAEAEEAASGGEEGGEQEGTTAATLSSESVQEVMSPRAEGVVGCTREQAAVGEGARAAEQGTMAATDAGDMSI